jgi:hypothetical protein
MKLKPFTEKDFFINPEKQPEQLWKLIEKWLKTNEAKQFEKDLEEIKH